MSSSSITPPLLEVNNLTAVFKKANRETVILDRVSFTLAKNKTLGIVGESGSGKTITALSILNLIPSPPLLRLEGEIQFGGQNLLHCSAAAMRKIRGKVIEYASIERIFKHPVHPYPQELLSLLDA